MSHVNARRKRQQGTEEIFEIAFPAARMGAGFHRVQGPARREQGGGQPVPRVGTWVHGVAGKGGQVSRLLQLVCQAHCPCPCPSFPPTFSSPGEGKKGLMQMEKKQKCNGLFKGVGASSAGGKVCRWRSWERSPEAPQKGERAGSSPSPPLGSWHSARSS